MITVTVLGRSNSQPQRGRKVSVHWTWSHSTGYTDGNGSVNLQGGPGTGTIYVSGQKVRSGRLSHNITVYG